MRHLRLCSVLMFWASFPAFSQIAYGPSSTAHHIYPKALTQSGVTTLGIDIKDRYGRLIRDPSTRLKLVFKVDNVPVSAVVAAPYEFSFNTATLADGPHALGVELVATTDPVGDPVTGYRARGTTLITINGNTKSTKGIPTFGVAYVDKQFASANADWVSYAGTTRPPLVSPPSTAWKTVTPSANGAFHLMEDWTVRRPLGISDELYSPSVEFVQQSGFTLIGQYNPPQYIDAPFPESGQNYNRFAYWDGPPQRARVGPLSTWIPVPDGPGWYGIDSAVNRLVLMTKDGNVTTLAGRYSHPTQLASPGNADATYRTKGNFIGPEFNFPHDIAVDVRDPKIVYVADTYNNRIAKVDLRTGTITTFAGIPGVEGIQDGPAAQATFHYPSSLETMPDGTIYVTQFGNEDAHEGPVGAEAGIRKISPSGIVTTVSTELVPFVIRRTSRGRLIVGHKTTGHVVEFNPATSTRRVIVELTSSTWNWLSVDRWGTVGPLDTIYYVSALGRPPGMQHNNYIYRINPNTNVATPGFTVRSNGVILNKGNTNLGDAENILGSVSHYIWEAVPDDEEGLFFVWGFGSEGPYIWELRPGVSREFDFNLYTTGKSIFISGTVRHMKQYDSTDKSPFNWPFGIRPSFTGLYGGAGHHFLNLPSFEEIAGWPAEQRAQWYKDGMGGATPRPELTGDAARALDYYICKSSHRSIDADCPKLPVATDRIAPTITNLQVLRKAGTATITWQTNEPAIGFVAFANANATLKHRWSAPESGYTTSHSRTIKYLEGTVNLQVLAKDAAGNSIWSINKVVLP